MLEKFNFGVWGVKGCRKWERIKFDESKCVLGSNIYIYKHLQVVFGYIKQLWISVDSKWIENTCLLWDYPVGYQDRKKINVWCFFR